MTEQRRTVSSRAAFPAGTPRGASVTLADLLGVSLAGLVIGVLALVLFDWAFASIGAGEFGRTNGWLAVILPAWLFLDDFRAWESARPGWWRRWSAAARRRCSPGCWSPAWPPGCRRCSPARWPAAAFTVAYAVWFSASVAGPPDRLTRARRTDRSRRQ